MKMINNPKASLFFSLIYFIIVIVISFQQFYTDTKEIPVLFESLITTPLLMVQGSIAGLLICTLLDYKASLVKSLIYAYGGALGLNIAFIALASKQGTAALESIIMGIQTILTIIILARSFKKKQFSFPILLSIWISLLSIGIVILMHTVIMMPILDNIKEKRLLDVETVISQKSLSNHICNNDHVVCGEYQELVSMKIIPKEHQQAFDTFKANSEMQYSKAKWTISGDLPSDYRVYGVTWSNEETLIAVISDKHDYKDLRILGNKSVYFLSGMAISFWLMIMFVTWSLHEIYIFRRAKVRG